MGYAGSTCTLPRNPWTGGFAPPKHGPHAAHGPPHHLPSPPLFSPRLAAASGEEEATAETPLMLAKRESTV